MAITKIQNSAKFQPQGIIANINIITYKLMINGKKILLLLSMIQFKKIISLLSTGYHNSAKFVMNKYTFFTQI